MDVKATNFERWQDYPLPPPAKKVPLPQALAKAALPTTRSANRLRFLTADGQTATPLEQEVALGTTDLVEASFLDRCMLVIGCIGRLRMRRGSATGFLIAPGLIMTNHHVFPDPSDAEGALIEFDYRRDVAGELPPTSEFALRPGEFFINDKDLDFAIVAAAPRSGSGKTLADRGYLRLHPESGKADVGDFVTIVQHPSGEPMQIAIRENEVTRASQDEPFIWYQADTAHGSSGAPVFNDSFQIAALHSSGRIKRNAEGEYALAGGGFAASLDGLSETDVVWEANVGMRVSRICARLTELARARSPAHARTMEAAMKGGDVLASAVERIKSRTGEAEADTNRGGEMTVNDRGEAALAPSAGRPGEVVIPLQLRISLETGGTRVGPPGPVTDAAGLEAEAFQMRIPVIYDGLDERRGFDRQFLALGAESDVPMPKVTTRGKAVLAPLLDGSGTELKYHKFSVWMQKDRRLALFTASNVDWRKRRKEVDGKSTSRKSLAGFPPDSNFAEQWVNDPRILESHQLPDAFYTEDRGAFDKGHLVRRDDVCWGETFEDIQMGNGDTYHVTNCSPQIKPFNQGQAGEENWGDLETHIQKATRQDSEKAVLFAGPIFKRDDRWFRGKDETGAARIQIPSRFWKIVVVKGDDGEPQVYAFVLEQDVRPITEEEFFVTDETIGALVRVSDLEDELRGWLSLADLKPFDKYDETHANLIG